MKYSRWRAALTWVGRVILISIPSIATALQRAPREDEQDRDRPETVDAWTYTPSAIGRLRGADLDEAVQDARDIIFCSRFQSPPAPFSHLGKCEVDRDAFDRLILNRATEFKKKGQRSDDLSKRSARECPCRLDPENPGQLVLARLALSELAPVILDWSRALTEKAGGCEVVAVDILRHVARCGETWAEFEDRHVSSCGITVSTGRGIQKAIIGEITRELQAREFLPRKLRAKDLPVSQEAVRAVAEFCVNADAMSPSVFLVKEAAQVHLPARLGLVSVPGVVESVAIVLGVTSASIPTSEDLASLSKGGSDRAHLAEQRIEKYRAGMRMIAKLAARLHPDEFAEVTRPFFARHIQQLGPFILAAYDLAASSAETKRVGERTNLAVAFLMTERGIVRGEGTPEMRLHGTLDSSRDVNSAPLDVGQGPVGSQAIREEIRTIESAIRTQLERSVTELFVPTKAVSLPATR